MIEGLNPIKPEDDWADDQGWRMAWEVIGSQPKPASDEMQPESTIELTIEGE